MLIWLNNWLQKFKIFLKNIDTKFCATNKFSAYNIILEKRCLIGKSYTYTVKRINRLLRHYLVHFARKTYSWSKSLNMIDNSVILFLYRNSITSIEF